MAATFDRLRCPLAQDKTEGPTTCLEYLGTKIDTVAMEMRLPSHKLEIADKSARVARAKMLHEMRPAATHRSTTACCYGCAARTHIYEMDVRPSEVSQ